MDGSEDESPLERSPTSRAHNTACVASTTCLGASRNVEEARVDRRLLPCADESSCRTCSKPADEDSGEVSLREWLDKPERVVGLLECLHVFRQIVGTVSLAHSQGIVVTNIRPSCFVISTFNRISFIESASCSSSGSDSPEHSIGGSEEKVGRDEQLSPLELKAERVFERSSDANCLHSRSDYEIRLSLANELEEKERGGSEAMRDAAEGTRAFPLKQILLMEFNWYTSPEEADGGSSTFASDIYRLGVLLFELFCTFDTLEDKLMTMSNLRHRVLPPQLLLKWPKQASFCLWLLHPQPDKRPKMDEVFQSEFLNEPRHELEERESAIRLREEMEEQELLLDFLLQLQQRKQEAADKLHATVCNLFADIEEVLNQQSVLDNKGDSNCTFEKDENSFAGKVNCTLPCDLINDYPACLGSRKRFRPVMGNCSEEHGGNLSQGPSSETQPDSGETNLSKSSRLAKNFKKLEAVYFSARWRLMKPAGKAINKSVPFSSSGRGSISRTEGSSVHNFGSKEGHARGKRSEWISSFFEGLSKYLTFSKFKVRADLKQGDLLKSPSLVCSLGFDRDKEFFATAGVNKKIKVFECDMMLDDDRDIHYPVIEMTSRSRFCSICWNGYIKSHIASSDFEGVVQVWDVTRGEPLLEMREHERRVWSVDFSLADPTSFASGSHDGCVKLWNINQAGSIATIQTMANVCSVQFPPDSAYTIAVGSTDHNVYCYDLRNQRTPYCSLIGHQKTVSYAKFVDSSTVVSASTDNSLKLWDLSLSTSRVLDDPLQTFTGHTNLKNFVGLSISDEYIATGSETNEVFVYHKAFPMPVLSHKFSSEDPITGQEVNDGTQFISCVCWRGQTSTLLAASSTGNIKLLEMV